MATLRGWMYLPGELTSALARSQLQRLGEATARSQRNAARLSERLVRLPGVEPPLAPPDRTHVFHKYRVRLDSARAGLRLSPVALRDAREDRPGAALPLPEPRSALLGGLQHPRRGDGRVLADPRHKRSKVRSKGGVLGATLGYAPHTKVGIEYVPSLGNWKTAWDFIHFRGFLGTKMSAHFMTHLACVFKDPLGVPSTRPEIRTSRWFRRLLVRLADPEGIHSWPRWPRPRFRR